MKIMTATITTISATAPINTARLLRERAGAGRRSCLDPPAERRSRREAPLVSGRASPLVPPGSFPDAAARAAGSGSGWRPPGPEGGSGGTGMGVRVRCRLLLADAATAAPASPTATPVSTSLPVDKVPVMAAVPKQAYQCSECGWPALTWVGRCGQCQAWGTVSESGAGAEQRGARTTATAVRTPATPIGQVDAEQAQFRPTGVSEFDRVLGGGLVPGAVVLLAGEPGVGKSTLVLDAAANTAANEIGRASCRERE